MQRIKRYLFHKTESELSEALTDKLLTSALSQKTFTRNSLAHDADISAVSTGKFVNALTASGFIYFSSKKPEDGSKIAQIFSFSNVLNTAVLELDCNRYSLSFFAPDLSVLLFDTYLYDSSLSREDNLSLFLARTANKIRERGEWPVSLAVLLPEEEPHSLLFPKDYLWHDRDRSFIDLQCARQLGQAPILYAHLSGAMKLSKKYELFPPFEHNIAYLRADRNISVIHFDPSGNVHILRTGDLMINDHERIDDLIDKITSEEDFGRLLAYAVNLADCCFAPDAYIIESAVLHTGPEVLKQMKRPFVLSSKSFPEFHFCSLSEGLLSKSLAKEALALVIKRHLITRK